jgi:pre-mRNA-splicing helicase BRR2
LIANRKKIVWCTKLARAKSDEEMAAIEREMYSNAELMDILGQRKATRASARDRKNAMIEEVKEEARRMLTSHGDAPGKGVSGPEVVDRDVAARQVLDLEALQFDGGGHYLASKSVQLPKETFRKLEKGYEEVCQQPRAFL